MNKIDMENRKTVCTFCEREGQELRFGGCWECATAQSVLASGRTMFEEDIPGQVELPVSVIDERLKKLIALGWRKW